MDEIFKSSTTTAKIHFYTVEDRIWATNSKAFSNSCNRYHLSGF
jgi:hypothetical protein